MDPIVKSRIAVCRGLSACVLLGFCLTVRPARAQSESIDFEKARVLLQREGRGEKLSTEEADYLQRAREARRAMQAGGRSGSAGRQPPRPAIGVKPLTEITGNDRYKGLEGGLYGGGSNEPPRDHRAAAENAISKLEPLDLRGHTSEGGTIGFISISMSNATQEFSRFKRIADADPTKSSKVTIVDCAQGGRAMEDWASPTAQPWSEAERRLEAAGLSPAQVQVAWLKLANKNPSGDLSAHTRKLADDTTEVLKIAKEKFPNLRIAYLSSRIYGGLATNNLNPEPYAYEGAFAVRQMIQGQINGERDLISDPKKGRAVVPVLMWGPYLWADGTTPRKSDGLVYTTDDFGPDGTHPSESGREKVAGVMLEFFKSDPTARLWFCEIRR